MLQHHGTQRVLALWVAVVNVGGAASTLLLPNRDPSPPALDAWLAGACLAASTVVRLNTFDCSTTVLCTVYNMFMTLTVYMYSC